jgi:hypothetical protein
MRFSKCLTLYYDPKKLKDAWGAEKTLEERIVLHIQSILASIEERQQDSSQCTPKYQVKEAPSLETKIFIVTFNNIGYMDAITMAKQMIEYTKIVSDPQIEMVMSGHQIPKSFAAVSHNKLLKAYQKLYPDINIYLELHASDDDAINSPFSSRKNSQEEISTTSTPDPSPVKPKKDTISPCSHKPPTLVSQPCVLAPKSDFHSVIPSSIAPPPQLIRLPVPVHHPPIKSEIENIEKQILFIQHKNQEFRNLLQQQQLRATIPNQFMKIAPQTEAIQQAIPPQINYNLNFIQNSQIPFITSVHNTQGTLWNPQGAMNHTSQIPVLFPMLNFTQNPLTRVIIPNQSMVQNYQSPVMNPTRNNSQAPQTFFVNVNQVAPQLNFQLQNRQMDAAQNAAT